MAEKKFNGAPFGTQTARFDVSGVHPKSKYPGTFTEIPYDKKSIDDLNRRLGPGSYRVDNGGFSTKAVEERADGPGWARAYEVERMAALPHLLHKDQWELKKILTQKLGPGSYMIKDFLELSDEKPRSYRGICQTKEQRFKDKVVIDTPGPGTYGDGGVPHAAIREKEKKSASTVGMLDAGSSTPRNLPSVGSKLGPGTYNFKSFTEERINKVTSTRGPYDLFSGDRNKPITVGHLAAPKLANLGPGQYDLKSFADELQTVPRMRQGKFGKVAQYPTQPTERIFARTLSQCPKDQEDMPGPGHYEPGELSKPGSKNAPGFLSTAMRNDRMSQRFFTRNFNPVGPGRYDIQKWVEAQHRNGNESVFRSKTGKLNAAMEKFLKERVRAKDVRLEDRVFLVTPEPPEGYMQRTKEQMQFTARKAATVV